MIKYKYFYNEFIYQRKNILISFQYVYDMNFYIYVKVNVNPDIMKSYYAWGDKYPKE